MTLEVGVNGIRFGRYRVWGFREGKGGLMWCDAVGKVGAGWMETLYYSSRDRGLCLTSLSVYLLLQFS